jgi:hypothetical protein
VTFRYIAPALTPGDSAVHRPGFWFSFTPPGMDTFAAWGPETARPADHCRRSTDSEPLSHCFGDPNFPVVSREYDFRRMVYYRAANDPAPLTDEKYQACSEMSELDIFLWLQSKESMLARLYFVGEQEDFDTTVQDEFTVYGPDATKWPAMYIDLSGNGTYELATDIFIPSQSTTDPPEDGYQGVPFAHVLAFWCNAKSVNPKLMITHLQAESQVVSQPLASSWQHLRAVLPTLLNYHPWGHGPVFWPSVQIAGGVTVARERFDNAPSSIPTDDLPHAGFLFPVNHYNYAADPDDNRRFTVAGPRDMPAAFFCQTRAAFALFGYTNQVNVSPRGGGNKLFMELWAHFDFDR